nr:hypothetical protein [Mycoplasmopsis bovis]
MSLLKIKKSTYYEKAKKIVKWLKKRYLWIREHCSSSFWNDTGGIFGRECLACLYYAKNKQIKLNYRTLGRIMKKLGLVCRYKKSKKNKRI